MGPMIGPALAMLSASVTVPQPLARAEAELRASERALEPHRNNVGFDIDTDLKAPSLLDRHWAAIRHWTEAWLDANRGASPGRLRAAAAEKRLDLDIEQVAPGVLAVSDEEVGTGTVFIVRRTANGFRTAWALSAPGRAALRAYPSLAGWTAARARDGCLAHWANCGPLSGTLGMLPPQRDGQKRFYLHAGYAGQGNMMGGQLSIWRWNGRTAKPLLAGTYGYPIDDPSMVSFDRGILHVSLKGEFKTFATCAPCAGRRMDWQIAVGPDRVRDLGRRDRVPAFAFIDDLFDRLARYRPLPRGAAGADLRLLRQQKFEMLEQWSLDRSVGREKLCMHWDTATGEATDLFILGRGHSGLRLLSVRRGPQAGCSGKTNR